MTEIPEHLRKRADAARAKAGEPPIRRDRAGGSDRGWGERWGALPFERPGMNARVQYWSQSGEGREIDLEAVDLTSALLTGLVAGSQPRAIVSVPVHQISWIDWSPS